MGPIYNYLRTVFQNLRLHSKQQFVFPFLLIVLLVIPLGYGVNSTALALLVVAVLLRFDRRIFHFDKALLLPLLLFALMAVSLCWSIDLPVSVRALQKGLPLLLLPLCFMAVPKLTLWQRQGILSGFAVGMVFFTLFWLSKAIFRFALSGSANVFFYHELVGEDLNAIHVSVYVAMAALYFLSRDRRQLFDKLAILLLLVFLMLLSSKNIFIVFVLLAGAYVFAHFRSKNKRKFAIAALGFGLLLSLGFMSKIKQRFAEEFSPAQSLNAKMSDNLHSDIYNVGITQAWTQDQFQANDYFPGTAFRVYQLRIFIEMLQEDAIFFTGYGLNASSAKIREKGAEHTVFSGSDGTNGYQDKNFHNQYVQLFAELGIFGLLLLVAMLAVNLKNAIDRKDFVHISFAILMISLFLTESFLSRQRGIIFFTMMYTLFNAKPALSEAQNTNRI